MNLGYTRSDIVLGLRVKGEGGSQGQKTTIILHFELQSRFIHIRQVTKLTRAKRRGFELYEYILVIIIGWLFYDSKF